MKGSRPTRSGEAVDRSVRPYEEQCLLSAKERIDTNRLAEVAKVGAATHRHMLAIVDCLTGFPIEKRPRPAA
jgi:hypothetical protein